MGLKLAANTWLAAAWRLLGKPAAVVWADDFPWPKTWGAAFYFLDWPVILIKENLPLLDKISTLVHECQHYELRHPPELRQVKGRWRFQGGERGPGVELVTLAAERDKMQTIEARLREKQAQDPRPPGWWAGEYCEAFAAYPDLIERRQAELLDCVY